MILAYRLTIYLALRRAANRKLYSRSALFGHRGTVARPAMVNGLPLQNLEHAGHTHDDIHQPSQNRCVAEQGRHQIVSEQPDHAPVQSANDNQYSRKNIDELQLCFSLCLDPKPHTALDIVLRPVPYLTNVTRLSRRRHRPTGPFPVPWALNLGHFHSKCPQARHGSAKTPAPPCRSTSPVPRSLRAPPLR